MKKLLTISLLFIGLGSFAQKRDARPTHFGDLAARPDTLSLSWCIHAFNKALVNKDTVELNRLLNDNLHYYHSNGMLQLKRDVVSDLYSGKLNYQEINSAVQDMHISGNIAQARMTATIDASMNEKTTRLNLSIAQVWIWKGDRWEMFARHSEKI